MKTRAVREFCVEFIDLIVWVLVGRTDETFVTVDSSLPLYWQVELKSLIFTFVRLSKPSLSNIVKRKWKRKKLFCNRNLPYNKVFDDKKPKIVFISSWLDVLEKLFLLKTCVDKKPISRPNYLKKNDQLGRRDTLSQSLLNEGWIWAGQGCKQILSAFS